MATDESTLTAATRAEDQLVITFGGPAVANGRMRVRDVAPSLMAMSELLQQAQNLLNTGDGALDIDLAARRRGSFEIDLVVAAAAFTAPGLLDDPRAQARLARVLNTVKGLIRFIKDLGDADIESTDEREDGQVEVHRNDGNITVINGDVHNLYIEANAREHAREVVRPLAQQDDYEVVRLRHGDDSVEVAADDWPAFSVPTSKDVLSSATFPAIVRVISPAFDGKKWRFSDGEKSFWASITDESFNAEVQSHEKVFGAGDVMEVLVTVQQLELDGRLSVRRTVERVLDHRQALRHSQPSLDDLEE